jgi:hypothetical protein
VPKAGIFAAAAQKMQQLIFDDDNHAGRVTLLKKYGIMNKETQANRWKEFHNSLEDGIAKKYKVQVERVPGISQSAFYRKIKEPQRWLTIAEKQAIARVYGLKEVYLFPELGDDVLPGLCDSVLVEAQTSANPPSPSAHKRQCFFKRGYLDL